MTWKKEEFNNIIRYDPAVTLLCNFSLKSDEELLYDVIWFIDGQEVVNQTVDKSSNYTAVITAHDMLKTEKKIGSDVHCKVGAKRKRENFPCLYKVGNPFFAGIKILNPNIELVRKGSKNVQLEMTIPFASESLFISSSPQPVSDLNIHMTFKTDDSSTCGGGGSSNQCEVKVKSFNYNEKQKYENGEWKQNISFPVYSQDTDGYVINSQMTLRLKTGGTNGVGSKIFEHVTLPDISISVREGNENWKGRSCGVRADPHMYTFDGKSYECQIPGEFINYRNQPQLQWIQSKHHLCFPSYDGPWCVCAVAARAGRDVFVIDLCGENNVISYELCEDNVLKVTKIHDKYYKIYFPTGTSLAIYIMEWSGHYNIDLEMLPSAMDIGNADGLCGYFDGVRENDFRRRNSSFTDDINLSYPNDFSRSWMIPDNENLFSGNVLVYNSLQSVSSILVPHCACTESGKTQCSYNTFTPCNSNRGKQYECNVDLVQNRRRKRDVSDMSMEKDPLLRKKRTISYAQTTEYSERVCLQAFENSPEYNTCQQHVTDLSNVTLSNCIEDIRMTGDDNLTQIHVEAALQQCSTFVLLNATLQEAEPEVTYTIQNLCPSNCTGHGTCNGGNCSCDTGFGGSDCSFDLLAPPTITSVPGAGLCDLSSKTCKEATIMGKYFFENMDSICYLTVKQTKINQTEEREERQMNLQERTLFEGFCPLPYDTTDIWTTEIKFNISNDGVRYTDTYNVIIFQSHCQEYHNESGNVYFTLKDNFCYIDSTCISPMQNSSTNECLYCNATNDKFNWTENECKCQTFIMKRYSLYFPLHYIILNVI
ncbi:von Willebrand factor D and EGF domain-containing protein-like [Saccostrea cucullata]|uniref:von Willebrand factor D and EGF domain-containing protein-like n=1 Tax=Saccostrea cuccullata TaxID=36930 RepID=UPI002ED2AEC8